MAPPWPLIVRLPPPKSPTVSSPAEFHSDPGPVTTTDAASPAVPPIVSDDPNPLMLAPPLISNVPSPFWPTVTAENALRLAPAARFHDAAALNCNDATVPVPVIVPPPDRNRAVSEAAGADAAGPVLSIQLAGLAKLVS